MSVAASIATGVGLFFFFLIMLIAIFIIIVGLPGTWIILAEAVIYGAVTGFDRGISGWDLLVLGSMAVTGELLEFLFTAYGAQKYGASNKAIAGALLGGLVGAILLNSFLPVIGAVIGAFAGVFLGAFIITYLIERDLAKANQSGLGAFMGRIGAVLVKGSMGVAMAAVIVSQVLF